MIIDCDSCQVRGPACDDCVVSALLGGSPAEIDHAEAAALDALAGSGLVPPLRLVVPVRLGPSGRDGGTAGEAGPPRAVAG